MNCNDSPIPSPNFSSGLSRNGVNKQYLTPCRPVGLRRKSGSAKLEETSDSKTRCASSTAVDTPKGTARLQSRKRILSPSEHTPVKTKLEKLENESSSITQCNTPKNATARINVSRENDSQLKEVESNHSSTSFVDAELLTSKSKAIAVLEDIKKRVDAKEKLKNSLQQRLHKLKKGNEHMLRLENLRTSWKDACQAALKDLLIKTNMQGHSLTMKQLMEKLGISNELLPYNSDEEEFEDVDPYN